MEKKSVLIAVLLVLIAVTAEAGYVTATLSATPAVVSEGGSSTLSLSITNTPFTHTTYYYSSPYYYQHDRYTGRGQINWIDGFINPGDGQSSQNVGSSVFSNSYSASRTFQFNTPGTYTASFNGTVSLMDVWASTTASKYNGHWYDNYREENRGSNQSINASTDIKVNNLDPSFASLSWNPFIELGQVFSFSALANDPAGVARNETMTIAYDFDGDGNYTDFIQSGSLFSSGTYVFGNIGRHRIGARVTDGLGGVGYGSFEVNVYAPEAVPAPASVAVWSVLSVAGIGCCYWRKRK